MSKRQRDRKSKRLRHSRKGRVAMGATVALGAAFAAPAVSQADPFTVSNAHDTGAGSLNQAITDANAHAGVDDINFSGVSGSINLTTELPQITDPVNINGPGASSVTINAPSGKRIFNLKMANHADPVNISGLTLSGGNLASDDGGAIYSKYTTLTVSHSVITGNQANSGGAIFTGSGSTTVRYSTIDNNHTNDSSGTGGAFASIIAQLTISRSEVTNNHSDGTNALAGAVGSELANTTLNDSLFANNQAKNQGGAVAIEVSIGPAATSINNTTFYNNHSTSGKGGAIYALTQQGTTSPWLTIDSATIAHNDASTGGGGIQVYGTSSSSGGNSVPPTIRNTIIAGNSSTTGEADIGLSGHVDPAATAFTLVQHPPAAGVMTETVPGSNILVQDPNLGGLANNGGPTRTLALNSGSPAIDKGSSALTADQRGSARPSDFPSIPNSAAAGANGADIGAFESLFVPPPPPVVPSIPAPTFGKLSTGGVKVGANSVSIVLTCASANCNGVLNLFTTEKLKGNNVVGLSRKKARKKRIKVGSKAYALTSGQTKRITVKLNSRGKKLLKKFKKVPVKLAVTQKQLNGKSVTIRNVKATIKAKKKKKHK